MFRIREEQDGYVVEVRRRNFWGVEYWIYFLQITGMPDMAWHFDSYDAAMKGLLREIKLQTLEISPGYVAPTPP